MASVALQPRDQLLYSTFLGGSGIDYSTSLAAGPGGEVLVTGETQSPNFPVTADACRSTLSGHADAFLMVLDFSRAGADPMRYSSYLGGTRNDMGGTVVFDGSGRAHVAGLASFGLRQRSGTVTARPPGVGL